ncbi:MAG: hypothetical protein ABSH53_18450 [Holophaga sp.]
MSTALEVRRSVPDHQVHRVELLRVTACRRPGRGAEPGALVGTCT